MHFDKYNFFHILNSFYEYMYLDIKTFHLHSWYIFSWKSICCIADEETCFTHSSVKKKYFHLLHIIKKKNNTNKILYYLISESIPYVYSMHIHINIMMK